MAEGEEEEESDLPFHSTPTPRSSAGLFPTIGHKSPEDLLAIPFPDQKVGGRLQFFAHKWQQIQAEPFIQRVVQRGYCLKFLNHPTLSKDPWFFTLPSRKDKREILHQEILSLLEKNAIEIVQQPVDPGFYALMFLVDKKDPGEYRPVFDLSQLNKSLDIPKFKMETTGNLTKSLKKGSWVTIIDLKDAYLHVPINQLYRKYLRFAYRGQIYQYKALPFGLATAPYLFTRLIKALALHMHMNGIDLHHYLDDWLNQDLSQKASLSSTQYLLRTTLELGLIPNWKKSILVPTQVFTYVGVVWNLQKGMMYPPLDRLQKIESAITLILSKEGASARSWLHLIGLLVSTEKQVPFGRTYMRGIQWNLALQWNIFKDRLNLWIPINPLAKQHMLWWMDRRNTTKGTPIGQFIPDLSIYTDSSKDAWGAHIEMSSSMTVSQSWKDHEKKLHINVLELKAIYLSLLHFQNILKNKKVMICSDNTTAIAYLNKQGGTKNWVLVQLSLKIMTWALQHQVSLKARHIPGKLNVMADKLSRPNQIMGTEWSIHPQVIDAIARTWEKPQIDLFATRYNNKLPTFVSPIPDPLAYAVDAVAIDWTGFIAFAYPPTAMIKTVLNKILEHKCIVYLIAPNWPQQPWFTDLLSLLIDQPRVIPEAWWKNLLQQPRTEIFHQNPKLMNLHVWPLSKDVHKRRDFLNKCPKASVEQSENLLKTFTKVNGNTGLIGAIRGKEIHSVLLHL